MASGEPKFSHITVTADDEDDVVIEAGARPATPVAPREEPSAAVQAEAPVARRKPEPVAADEAPEKRSKDDDYRETTIDDLKSTPMPLAQKIVLAVAAVAVVGIVVYYFFMR